MSIVLKISLKTIFRNILGSSQRRIQRIASKILYLHSMLCVSFSEGFWFPSTDQGYSFYLCVCVFTAVILEIYTHRARTHTYMPCSLLYHKNGKRDFAMFLHSRTQFGRKKVPFWREILKGEEELIDKMKLRFHSYCLPTGKNFKNIFKSKIY